MTAKPNMMPATQVAQELDQAYQFFNDRLFGGRLPPAMIILERSKDRYGHFIGNVYVDKDAGFQPGEEGYLDEIGLNPLTFRDRPDGETLSTLVHEQVHLWQHRFGNPPKRAYHNGEWADKMEEVGLMPSTTGREGGKRTGRKCSHYIVPGGAFDVACRDLLAAGFRLSWASLPLPTRPRSSSGRRVKYVCPCCDQKAWAKEDARLTCGDCEEALVPG